ncbi:sterol-binding-like protein [Sorangium atrum]|uniref:Sterol-binding-like protein n=1 Tax=Sorangium atrum TaxID=2995308 RepID=A0ABT5CEC0_9BACT|nr:sterol-binding-like protein [Sorangium aterium]MDC0683647.1 sterol-binding-like protein [Sorangium aterium]MDC0684789.1 sterol-binding-like protein [Sorangium aterium]
MAALLDESFATLARELPEAYARMCARFAGKTVRIEVDGERFVAAFESAAARVRRVGTEDDVGADASITTSRRAIRDVLEARRSLSDAVLADEVEAVAPLDSLVEVLAGLSMYVHGAVRCPSFPRLLERFQGLLAGDEEV